MAHGEIVMELMNQLVYATKHDIGDIMAHKRLWTAGTSTINNSYKELNTQVDAGTLEKGGDYFKLKGMAGNHLSHSRLITAALIKILKLNYTTTIYREHEIKQCGLRPDSLVLLNKDNQAVCFVLEVCNNEFPEFLQQKINTWNSWEESKDYLSQLFKTKIKAFDIVVSGDITADGTFELNSYIEEVKNA